MKIKGFALLLVGAVVVGGSVGYLAGNASGVTPKTSSPVSGASTRTASPTAASGQTTTVASGTGSGRQGQGQAGAGLLGGGTIGTVQKVAGDVITLSAPDGSTVTVNVASTTVFQKTGQGTVADISTGATITAVGTTQSDGTISAATVSIGAGQMLSRIGQLPGGSSRPGLGTGSSTTGSTGSGGLVRPGGGSGTGASGTVQSVQGNVITIVERTGATATITIGAGTVIEKMVQAGISDIVTGGSVIVTGARNSDGSVSATNITIMLNSGS